MSTHDRVSRVVLTLLTLVRFFVALLVTTRTRPRWPSEDHGKDHRKPGTHLHYIWLVSTQPAIDLPEFVSQPYNLSVPFTTALTPVKRAVRLNQTKLDVVSQKRHGKRGNEDGNRDEWQPRMCNIPVDGPIRGVHFDVDSIDSDARQLDSSEIKLGVLRPLSGSIVYARRFTESAPARRDSHPRDEKRNVLVWHDEDPLAVFDRKLLTTAGVDVAENVMIQLWLDSVWRQLLAAETQFARRTGLFVELIHSMDFGVKTGPGRFEFYIIHQQPKLEHIGKNREL